MATKAQHANRYRTIPPLLRAIREEAGLTQRDVGAQLKEPQAWVHNCETANRRVDLAEFCEWCEACGLDAVQGVERFLAQRGKRTRPNRA